MTRIEWLTHEHFAPLVGEGFAVTVGPDEALTVELVEATASAQPGGLGPDGQERAQFSLVFRGPATPFLSQGTYVMTHEAVGDQELFLVPLGRDTDSVRYEAAFA